MILGIVGVILGLLATAPGALLLALAVSPARRWDRLWILCLLTAPPSLLFGLCEMVALTLASLPPGMSTSSDWLRAAPWALLTGACSGMGGIFSAGVGVMLGLNLRRRALAARGRRP